jgi:uncharacterized protein YjdB/fibronectin type 3 domain-containing protein
MKRFFLMSLIILSLIFSSFPTNITASAKGDFFTKSTEKSNPKLGPSLNSAFYKDSLNTKGVERVKKDMERLHVYVEFSHPSVLEALGKWGNLKNLNEELGLAEMILPARAIEGLINNPHIISIREVMKPIVNRGYATSQGFYDVGGQGIDTYLKMNGKAGDGIKIGVISDGVGGLSDAVNRGDLPANVTVLSNIVGGAEGTAMLEVIHDLAPNAQLYFHDMGYSSLDFIGAINNLVAAGVDIIIDDIVYLDEPFFEDSNIAKHINQLVTSTGILYISSAGNFAQSHVQSTYRPVLRNSIYEHDFSTSESGVQRMPILVPARSSVVVMLQWNEPFQNSAKDLELAVCSDNSTNYCFISDNYQLGSGYSPVEYVDLINTSYSDITQYVTVYSEMTLSTLTFEVYLFGGSTVQKYGTRTDSTFGHSTSANVLSVAAINTGTVSMQAFYSSQGPFTMVNGTTRNKPDFTGVDCVSVSGAGGFPNDFCGSSAAAPHIGAIAALMWSNSPALTRSQLIDAMKVKSFDLGAIGYDYQTGYGLVHLGVYGMEVTNQKTFTNEYYHTFDRPGVFSVDNTSVLSLKQSLYQTNQISGVTYYTYYVTATGLINGTANVKFTANDTSVLYRQKFVIADRVVNLHITEDTVYLQANQSHRFSYEIVPFNATNASFTFASSNTAVATVDTSGNIIAKSTGTARVAHKHTATGMTIYGNVNVGILSTSLTISPRTVNLLVGESAQLTATFSPSNATFKKVDWKSSYSDYVSVDANGIVTAHQTGSVSIQATSQDGKSSDSIIVKVIEPLTSISFSQSEYAYYFTDQTYTTRLHLNKLPYNSNEADLVWSSSNPSAIDVDQEGLLTIKSVGSAVITVNGARGLTASTIVNVTLQPYTNYVHVERNGVVTNTAFALRGTYGQVLTQQQMKEIYHQALGLPAGKDVKFYRRYSISGNNQLFGIISDYIFKESENLYAIEVPIDTQSLAINDVTIEADILNINGRFTPDRPYDIRYRYTISDPTVLQPIIDAGSATCTLQEIEYACAPGSFTILSAGSVSITLESFDGKFKDTIRVQISGEPGNYRIDDFVVKSLSVNSIRSDQLQLTWSAVPNATGYEIYRLKTIDGTYEKIADVSSAMSLVYVDANRLLNQPNDYKVRAYTVLADEVIYGGFSETIRGSTRPDPLTNATVTSENYQTLRLNVPANAKIVTYQWAYSGHPDGPYTVLTENASISQLVSNLFAGNTYYFKVRYAMDTDYGRVYSDYSSLITAIPIPNAPTIMVIPISSTTIRVEILPVEGSYGYILVRIVNGKEAIVSNGNYGSFEFNDIRPGDQVGFKAQSYTLFLGKNVYSKFSPIAATMTLPSAVTGLTVSNADISSVSLRWNASTGAHGYELSQSLTANSGFSVVTNSSQLNHYIGALSFNTTYYYRIRPYVVINSTKYYGDYSAVISAKTVVPTVSGINAKVLTYNSNRLDWTKVDLASGYEIHYSKGTSTTYTLLATQTAVGYTHSALIFNTKYNYKVRAYAMSGSTKIYGAFSAIVSATPLTPAPVVTVTSTAYNSLKVSWPAVSGASGYEISYSLTQNGTYTKLPLTTTLSATIANTLTNKTYYVKVRAYRTVDTVKIYGNTGVATGVSVPNPPTLTLTSAGYDTINVSWGSVAGATGYQLYILEGTTYRLLTDTTALSFVDKGKITGKDTTYKVLSYRLVDNVKAFSNETIAIGRALPAMATNMKVSGSDVSSLTLVWSAVPGATGYEISQATTSTGTYTVVGNVSTLTFIKTGLGFNTTYYYKVRAFRLEGSTKFYGPLSSAYSGKTALTIVNGVTAGYTSYNTNSISWNAVAGASGYAIYYSKGTSTTYSLIKYQTATTLTHTSLITNTKYNYKVRAYKMVGTTRIFGPYSTISSSTPLPMPPVISVTSAGYNSVNVSWPAVAGASGYEVGYSSSANGTYTLLPPTTKTSAVILNLTTNVPVYVRVRTYRTVSYVNRYGNYSTVVSGIPIPSAPTLTLSSAGFDSIKIAWAAVAGASGYEVYILDGTYRLLSDTAALSVVDGGKVTGVESKYKVRAYRLVNNIKVYGPETLGAAKALPSLAADFKISLVDITSLAMTWSPVAGASGYEISQSTTSTGTYALVGDVSGNEFKKTGLTFNRTYYYKIRAYTTVNNVKHFGPSSVAISAKTVPSPVVLTVTPLTGRINSLTWQPINGASGYQIYYSTGTSTSYSLLTTVTTNSYSHKALVLGRRYNYRVRAYRMSGTTRIYGDYSPVISAVAIN